MTSRVQLQTEWEFYSWSETATNNEGLSLRACMERYGVGGWYSKDKDMIAALIFLSADRTNGNSWLLGLKRFNGVQAAVRVHDRTKKEDLYTYKLSLDTSLGVGITHLLADCVFGEV